jgi:hypothetical protein
MWMFDSKIERKPFLVSDMRRAVDQTQSPSNVFRAKYTQDKIEDF